jgi:hypothetical protein
MTKTKIEPWVSIGEPTGPPAGFYTAADNIPGFLPGQLALLRRAEDAERAGEERRQAEALDRADTRQELARWAAKQRALLHGLP